MTKLNFRYFYNQSGKFYHFNDIDEAIKFGREEKILDKMGSTEPIIINLDIISSGVVIGGIDFEKLIEEVNFLEGR